MFSVTWLTYGVPASAQRACHNPHKVADGGGPMTSTAKPELQGYKGGDRLMDRFAQRDHVPAPTDRDQALAIGFIIALIVFITVL
jgi:hypothetical protein